MKTSRHHRIAQLLLWVTPALWSSNYIIARTADGVITPNALTFWRWALALALMLPFAVGALVSGFTQWRREWKQMLVLGALGMGICGAFVYIGARTTSATNIGLIYAATPMAIALAGALVLHERVTLRQRVGMALAVRFTVGDGWALGAAASWVAYTVLLQRWPSVLGSTPRLAAIIVGGLLVLLPFTLYEAWTDPGPPLGMKALGLIVLAALLPSFLAYQAYSFMLRELGVARAGLVMYLSPIYAALAAWALLGEAPRWYHVVGAALILPSIYLATRSTARPASADATIAGRSNPRRT